MLRAAWKWLTAEPVPVWRRRTTYSLQTHPEVLRVIRDGIEEVELEAQHVMEVIARQAFADHYSGDTRYAGLEAIEERLELRQAG